MKAAEGCFGLIFFSVGYFVSQPLLALFPAAAFLLYYFARRTAAAARGASGQVRWSLIAGLAWAVYPFYEMAADRQFQDTLNPIRVDLALVLPVLFLLALAAFAGGVAFERSPLRSLEPFEAETFKPIPPGPYALRRNRPFVIGLAAVLVSSSILSYLLWMKQLGLIGTGGLLVLPVLAMFLVRGQSWARWCLVLWLTYRIINHLVWWTVFSHQGMDAGLRMAQLGFLLLEVLVLANLLFSRRLREHLDVHSFPSPVRAAPR